MTDLNRVAKDLADLGKDPNEFIGVCSGVVHSDGTVNVLRPDGGSINAILANTGRGSNTLCQCVNGVWYAWREGESRVISEQTVLNRRVSPADKSKKLGKVMVLFSKFVSGNKLTGAERYAFYIGGHQPKPIKIWEDVFLPSLYDNSRPNAVGLDMEVKAKISNCGNNKWIVTIRKGGAGRLGNNETNRLVVIEGKNTYPYANVIDKEYNNTNSNIYPLSYEPVDCGHGFVFQNMYEDGFIASTVPTPYTLAYMYVYKNTFANDQETYMSVISPHYSSSTYFSYQPNGDKGYSSIWKYWYYLPGKKEINNPDNDDGYIFNNGGQYVSVNGQYTAIVDKSLGKSLASTGPYLNQTDKNQVIFPNRVQIKTKTEEEFVFENPPSFIYNLADSSRIFYKWYCYDFPYISNWIEDSIYVVGIDDIPTQKIDFPSTRAGFAYNISNPDKANLRQFNAGSILDPVDTSEPTAFSRTCSLGKPSGAAVYQFGPVIPYLIDRPISIPIYKYDIDYQNLQFILSPTVKKEEIFALDKDCVTIHSVSYHPSYRGT